MLNRYLAWIPAVMAIGCGGSQPPAVSPGPAEQNAQPAAASTTPVASKPASEAVASPTPATAPTRSAADQAADAKRAQAAAKAIEVLSKSDVDKDMLPRAAASELSEADYGLPQEIRKGLAAIGGGRMDPSQILRIIQAIVEEEPLASALQSLCGKPARTVLSDAKALSAQGRTGSALARCNQKPADVLGSLDPGKVQVEAALLSVALLNVIQQRGGATEPERKLVRMLAGFSLSP